MKMTVRASLVIVAALILAELATVYLSPHFGMLMHTALLVSLVRGASYLRGTYKPHPLAVEVHEDSESKETCLLGVLMSVLEPEDELPRSKPTGPSGKGGANRKILANFLLVAAIAPLIRVFSLAMPLWFFPRIAWHLIVSLPILAGVVALARYQDLGAEDLGSTLNRFPLQISLGSTGFAFGFAEYFILKPEPLVGSTALGKLIHPIFFLVFATGFVEELAFRGAIQKNSIETLGKWPGMLFVASIFAGLHMGNSFLDAAYVFPIALFFGLAVLKTKSILGTTLPYGITNAVLFVVTPLMMS